MRCPVCDHTLRPTTYEGCQVHSCGSCGGEFLGADELRHIVATTRERFGPQWTKLVEEHTPRFGVPADEQERSLACPACMNAMTVVNYAGDTAVFADKCGACGSVWLDGDELEKVQAIVERWSAGAPPKLRSISMQLEKARQEAAGSVGEPFAASRFSFVNAVMNRLLDAA